ncbi:MAG: hypothetical protein FWC83_00370 [Alphaproteobacteria bacterium]|nr:hypothetical protein [Alphaproteobacteria bacterium]
MSTGFNPSRLSDRDISRLFGQLGIKMGQLQNVKNPLWNKNIAIVGDPALPHQTTVDPNIVLRRLDKWVDVLTACVENMKTRNDFKDCIEGMTVNKQLIEQTRNLWEYLRDGGR